MKVLPKLCAAIVACAAFMLATNGAWAENLDSSQHASKGITNPSGKQGAKTSSNRMAKADGKQPRKKAPTNYKDPSVSSGVSRGEAAGKRSEPGRSSLNEVDVGKVSGASNNKLFGGADPSGSKSRGVGATLAGAQWNTSGVENKVATRGSKKSGNSANAVSAEIQIPKK